MLPVALFGVAFNMNDIKKALGRDGETERVRESVQSGAREIGWVNDGFQFCVGHFSVPQKPAYANHLTTTSSHDDICRMMTVLRFRFALSAPKCKTAHRYIRARATPWRLVLITLG